MHTKRNINPHFYRNGVYIRPCSMPAGRKGFLPAYPPATKRNVS